MSHQLRFRPNTPAVTSETFDTEVVIVNFETGAYHSVQGTGVETWRRIERGASVDDIVAVLAAHYDGEPASMRAAIEEFVAQLAQYGLVIAEAGADGAGEPGDEVSPAAKRPFEPPALNTFTDMQELLWLDPIHEVDEAGWPVAAHEVKG